MATEDSRYTPSDSNDKRRISELKMQIESYRDFIDFLFNQSEHCDHITESEAWQEFENHKEISKITDNGK